MCACVYVCAVFMCFTNNCTVLLWPSFQCVCSLVLLWSSGCTVKTFSKCTLAHKSFYIVRVLAPETCAAQNKKTLGSSSEVSDAWNMMGLLVLCVFAAVLSHISASTEMCTNILLPGPKGNTYLMCWVCVCFSVWLWRTKNLCPITVIGHIGAMQ